MELFYLQVQLRTLVFTLHCCLQLLMHQTAYYLLISSWITRHVPAFCWHTKRRCIATHMILEHAFKLYWKSKNKHIDNLIMVWYIYTENIICRDVQRKYSAYQKRQSFVRLCGTMPYKCNDSHWGFKPVLRSKLCWSSFL